MAATPVVGVAHDVFTVKSKRGRIVRVAREHYLRADIPSGINDGDGKGLGLHDDATHFLIPDANTLLRFLDVFEVAREWRDIVILQTVLDNFCQQATSRAQGQLTAMTKDPSRRFILFDNEHHHRTFQSRKKGEATSIRDLKAVAKAAEFLSQEAAKQAGKRKHRPVIVIWDPVVDSPLTKPEEIRGVIYMNLSAYMTTWQTASTGVFNAYQEAVKAEEATHARFASLSKATLSSDSKVGGEGQGPMERAAKSKLLSTALGAATKSKAASLQKGGMYPAHLELETLERLRKSHEVFVGKLVVSGYNPMEEAKVQLSPVDSKRLAIKLGAKSAGSNPGEVFLDGFEARNRAIHGDKVYISLVSKTHEALSSSSVGLVPSLKRSDSEGTIVDDRELDEDVNELKNFRGKPGSKEYKRAGSRPAESGLLLGVVVGIRERRWREFVCTLKQTSTNGGRGMLPTSGSRAVIAIPMDRRLPRLMLKTSQSNLLENQRLVCRFKAWPRQYRLPEGYYVRKLGTVGTIEAETRAVCLERGVWHPKWSDFLLRGLPNRELASREPEVKIASRTRYHWEVPVEEASKRLDLRKALQGCVFSVDPQGCEDVDDALSVRVIDARTWEVGVHIADVTHFVRGNSPLDREAAARATSVYLVDRRLDMLPKVLSTDLCSLRGGTDRLAVSVLWHIDPIPAGAKGVAKLNVKKVWFGRTVIHNTAAISYEQAQRLVDTAERNLKPGSQSEKRELAQIDGDAKIDILRSRASLIRLRDVARCLRRMRRAAGALELASFVTEFDLEDAPDPNPAAAPVQEVAAEYGKKDDLNVGSQQPKKKPSQVKKQHHDIEMHHTVEELMIFANCAVAKKIFESKVFGQSALLRRHPLPNLESFAELKGLSRAQGIPLKVGSNKELQESLDAAVNHFKKRKKKRSKESSSSAQDIEWSGRLFRSLATKAMAEAEYVAAADGMKEQKNQDTDTAQNLEGASLEGSVLGLSHYGLAAPLYTHFTSPIRRYADIIVHRQLMLACMKDENKEDEEADVGNITDRPSINPASSEDGLSVSLSSVREQARRCNDRSRGAKLASRDSQKLFLHVYLNMTGPTRYSAIVFALRQNGFLAFVPALQAKVSCRPADKAGNGAGILISKFESSREDSELVPQTDAACSVQLSSESHGKETLRIELKGQPVIELKVLDPIFLEISTPDAPYRIPDPQGKIIVDVKKCRGNSQRTGTEARISQDFSSFKNESRKAAERDHPKERGDAEVKSGGAIKEDVDLYGVLGQQWSSAETLDRVWTQERKRNHSRLKSMRHLQKHVREALGSRINWAPQVKMSYEDLVRASGATVE